MPKQRRPRPGDHPDDEAPDPAQNGLLGEPSLNLTTSVPPEVLGRTRRQQIAEHQAAIDKLRVQQEALDAHIRVWQARGLGAAPDVQARLDQRITDAVHQHTTP